VELGLKMEKSRKAREKEWKENEDELVEQMMRATRALTGSTQAESMGDRAKLAVTEQDRRAFKNAFSQGDSIGLSRKSLLAIVVRRTGESRTPDGSTVMQLSRFVESTVWTVPSQREKGVQDTLRQQMVGDSEKG
jgi:hypothetical protein